MCYLVWLSVGVTFHIVLEDFCLRLPGFVFLHRNRIRQYPAFVNCTTIDWFSEWPNDALLEVAEKYLEEASLGKTTAGGRV